MTIGHDLADNWYDEEARSQIWNEKAQKIYDLYIWNALAFLNNVKLQCLHRDEDGECIEYEEPNEMFMRIVENAIDISEKHARDFRASVTSKHCSRLKNTSYAPRWHDDGAMYQAIAELLRMMNWAENPTIKIITADDVCKVNGKYKCTCSMDTLMSTGCKCGHLERYENTR